MQYSDAFKEKVLAAFDNNEEIRQRLDEGQEIIGRYLDDCRYDGVSAEEIVEACENKNVQGIYAKAKRQIAMTELYGEWKEIYRNQHKSKRMHM